MRYILQTVYISVFDMMILLWEAVTSLLVAQIDYVAFKHKIRHYARLAIFGCILYNVFGEGSNSVIVSGRLANLIMISEEHWKMIKYCSKMFTGIGSQ